ncbi:MAG: serine/threonine-protein phosphatase [Bacilli bacterium]|nr:serine/threonine-protein phosphatase [Bacilli bacterium]
MGRISIVAAIIMVLLMIGYITKLFPMRSYNLVYVFFPISIVALAGAAILSKTKFLYKSGFKYYAMATFILAFAILSVIVPKHAILTWAIPVAVANHYYRPKLSLVVFIICAVSLVACVYLGAFFGEYDPNLLSAGKVIYDEATQTYVIYQPDNPVERWNMLIEWSQKRGANRFLQIFLFYCLPRLLALTIVFLASYALSNRTQTLLVNEIKATESSRRIDTELNVAREIQYSALPKEFRSTQHVDILAELVTAKEVGGDLYDYVVIDDEHIGVLIGDVSGKGIPAAMFMMKTITSFRAYINTSDSPAEIMRNVNKILYNGNESKMFVTCFLAILNTRTGVVKFANAGHNPPIIGEEKNYKYLKCNSGFLLGAMEDSFAIDEVFTLKPGQTIFFYTDGITEARDVNSGFFGEKHLLETFNKVEGDSIIDLHHTILEELKKYMEGADQFDDMTYVMLRYKGDEIVDFERIFSTDSETSKEAISFVNESLSGNGYDSLKDKFSEVVDEVYSNISRYVYGGFDGKIYLRLSINKKKNELILTFIDGGEDFNILSDEVAKDGHKVEIIKTKSIMDEASYSRIHDKNIIYLRKEIDSLS